MKNRDYLRSPIGIADSFETSKYQNTYYQEDNIKIGQDFSMV